MTRHAADFAIDGSSAEFPLGRFRLLGRLNGLAHGVSTLAGPDFSPPVDAPAHAAAAGRLARALGLEGAAWLRQVHGNRVLVVDKEGLAGEADGLVTTHPQLALLVRGADCLLVLAAGPVEQDGPAGLAAPAAGGGLRVAGAAHASWRGTVAGVAARLIETMAARSGVAPARMAAALSPSAGPCCYEVSAEVREAALSALGPGAEDFFTPSGAAPGTGSSPSGPPRDGKFIFDLWAANAAQLRASGLPADHIAAAKVCTICGPPHFPSHRRQGEGAGRIAAALGWFAAPSKSR